MSKNQNQPPPESKPAAPEKQDQWNQEFTLKEKDLVLKEKDFVLKKKDMWLRITIPVLTVIIGLAQFYYQQRSNEKLRFKADLWNRQHQMYLDVADAIGKINAAIASQRDDSTVRRYMISFKIPYWKSTLVEDPAVTDELINYNLSIDFFINTDTTKGDGEKELRLDLLDSIPLYGEKVIKTMSNSLEAESLEKWHDKK